MQSEIFGTGPLVEMMSHATVFAYEMGEGFDGRVYY